MFPPGRRRSHEGAEQSRGGDASRRIRSASRIVVVKALTKTKARTAAQPSTRRHARNLEDAIEIAEAQTATQPATPRYELRVQRHGPTDAEYQIWQLPNAAAPHLRTDTRVAGLRGRNLSLVEHRVLRRLAQSGIKLGQKTRNKERGHALTENLALTLGLLFRTLAPMRNRENMRTVAEGIEAMQREEAAYWLGMAMHRKRPRRVLAALRVLLTEPRGAPVRSPGRPWGNSP